MKAVNFIIVLALSIANHVAHGKFVTVKTSAEISYEDITVTRIDRNNGAYEMVHSVNAGTNDVIDKIIDVKTTFTKNNPKVGTRVSILNFKNGSLLKYPHPGKNIGKSDKWVCNIKTGKKWEKMDCTKFNIMWDSYVSTGKVWEFPQGNDFITVAPLHMHFTQYVLAKKDVFVEGIIENEEALWTLAESGWKRFSHAYQFDKSGFSFFLVAHLSGQDEISYKVLVSGKHSWIPLTENLSKYFANVANKIRAARNPALVPEITVKQLPETLKEELALYINAENAKQGVLHELKSKREKEESNPKGITIDLKKPNESKLYGFQVSTFDREKEVVVRANSGVEFIRALFGGVDVYTNNEFPSFLLVYTTNGEVSIINALSRNDGESFLTQYEKQANGWVDVSSPDDFHFLYPINLDATTWVDERFLSLRKEIHFGEFCEVYTPTEYIGVGAIYEKNKLIWRFETPQRDEIQVCKTGKEREYRFVMDFKGVEKSVHVTQVGGKPHFKFDGEGDWLSIEKYIERFAY